MAKVELRDRKVADVKMSPAAEVHASASTCDSSDVGVHLFVLIDALGWPYVEQADFLPELLPYRKSIRTVLGFSSGAVPTLLTGKLPSETSHWNLFYYDPEGSPFRWLRYLSFLPNRLLDNRVSRKILKELGRRVLGMGPLFECVVSPRYLSWFNYVEKKSLYGPGGVSGAQSIFDDLETRNIPYHVYSYHRFTDVEIFRQARKDLERSKARFFFLYLSEMDMFLHHQCHDLSAVASKLDWYGNQLRELVTQAARTRGYAQLTVFSDHGMTRVRGQYDVARRIESLGWKQPLDFLAVFDSTMARFWFFSEEARAGICSELSSLDCGDILTDEELRQLGVYFEDSRYGEVIFLMKPGWLMTKSHFNGPRWMPVGMHGYHPDDPDSDAVFLSSQAPSREVRTIADVYRCMREVIE